MNRSIRSVTSLATGALVAVSLFPLIVIALNLVQRHSYSPTRQAISELALGTGGSLMALAFCGLGAGIFLLAASIHRTSRKARTTPLLLTLAAVLAGPVSAAFHTDRTGAKTTLHGTIHDTAGLVAFLLILLAMITGAYRFRHESWWRSHAAPTAAFAALGAVTFFLIPMLGSSHFGLAQRLFIGTFIAWLLWTAGYARNRSTADSQARADDSALTKAGASLRASGGAVRGADRCDVRHSPRAVTPRDEDSSGESAASSLTPCGRPLPLRFLMIRSSPQQQAQRVNRAGRRHV